MLISLGLVGPKTRPKGVADGQQVNIPVQINIRQSNSGSKTCLIFDSFGLKRKNNNSERGASSGGTWQDS